MNNSLKFLKRFALLIATTLIFVLPSSGQKGYYAIDSTVSVGVKIIDAGSRTNARLCKVVQGDTIAEYSPYEVKEYGFRNGKTYLSKEIIYSGSKQRFFLERLSKGKFNLYYFAHEEGSSYYVEKDSTAFFELPEGNKNSSNYFRKRLQEITSDFPEISENAKLVSYNKKSLTRFFNDYNQERIQPFPHLKVGFSGLYETTKLMVTSSPAFSQLNELNLNAESSFGAGIFIDMPITVSNLSWHLELQYINHGFSFHNRVDNKDIDLTVNISTLKTPLMLRYIYPANKFIPFVNAGAVLSFNVKNESRLFETTFSENTIQINDLTNNKLIADFQQGIAAGVGVEYELTYKHSLFFEIRYNYFPENGNSKTLQNSDIQFITSVNF